MKSEKEWIVRPVRMAQERVARNWVNAVLFHLSLFLFPCSSPASQALTNLVDTNAVRDCFADYTNNILRIESVDASEWDASRRLDRLPFDMPFQLVVGPDAADRAAAEAALTTVVTSMPAHIRAYFSGHHLMALLQQRLLRRCQHGISDEKLYLTAAAHPNVWREKDFDLGQLASVARNLTSNDVPMMANLSPIYEEYALSPIRRAEPLVDYPDPRPEQAYVTHFGAAVVLRAPESRRKFRFYAAGWPFNDRNVNFKWIGNGVSVGPIHGQKLPMEKGYADLMPTWSAGTRRDVLVFARYGEGPWGPPSVISFYCVPNEKRTYDKDGRIEMIEYLPAKEVIPQLYQNKPWRDAYVKNSLGDIVGFQRTRLGKFTEESFCSNGERILESYAGDRPKVTAAVRYFTRKGDPATLDYEVTKKTVTYPDKLYVPRNRGEFPVRRKKR